MRLLLGILSIVALTLAPSLGQAPARVDAAAEAIRLNNLGVASMNQQKFEPALERFTAALAADGSLAAARVNQAIALTALQRYEEARPVLDAIVTSDPASVRAWYNLGLLVRTLGESEAALAAFERAAELAPRDPYTHYFTGLIASQLQQQDKAIAAFGRALEIDPFLVSAEFGLARAYQRTGRTEDAKRHMDRFTRLTEQKVASAMSLAYGDQGPLSLALAVQPRGGDAPAAIPVKFVAPRADADPAPPTTSALCLIDTTGDGSIEIVTVGGSGVWLSRGAEAPPPQATPSGGGTLAPAPSGGGASAPRTELTRTPATACAVADYDNDEKPDIALAAADGVRLLRNDGNGGFAQASAVPVMKNGPGATITGLAFVDFDHDADVDLFVTRRAAAAGLPAATAVVLRNNGDGTFLDVSGERGLGVPNAAAATASDLNNDRAVDLVFTGETVRLAINPREGTFKTLTAFTPYGPADTRGVAVLDFDKDGWMDLAFTHEGAPGVSVWRNVEGRSFAKVELPASPIASGGAITALDIDNDGWLDLAAIGVREPASVIQILRNAAGTFEDVSGRVGVGDLASSKGLRALAAADLDADNDTDLIVPFGQAPAVLRNDGGNANASVRIALLGLNDNRSGIGTKIEVQAGAVWQKFETSSALAPELVAGLGKAAQADVVRLLWPTGVVQDEVELKANTRHAITQIDRRGSSCPVLFSWNGERYEFIADAIGPAVIGHWVAPNTRNIPDVDEYVKVEGRHVAVKDGRLSFRFAEPMEEVIYLDQVKLIAVDHPAGTDVYPNEYFAAMPPHPVSKTIATRNARLPVGAWDGAGNDARAALSARDRTFVEAGLQPRKHTSNNSDHVDIPGLNDADHVDDPWRQGLSPAVKGVSATFKGFAPLHSLTLDLGDIPRGAPVRLLMHGFTDYFTANSIFAAHQANVTAVLPWVEAQMPDGTWRRISDDIGFPAGLLRTMTADLSGKLPPGARRIRVWTNLKIYWDQILVDTTPDNAVPVRHTEIPLAEASLAFRGFPREITGSPATDLQYVHGEVSKYGPYARHRGFYTKYGDVMPLLGQAEDHFVIFGAGDEVALEFDAAALPPLPEGWTRDYFVYFNGYVKDMDFYAAHAQTVAPLPFKQMSGYPYPGGTTYPDRHREYLLEWNTREVAGEGWPTYRFSYDDHDGTTARRH
jgi:Tfp pilus assembly protein PilF